MDNQEVKGDTRDVITRKIKEGNKKKEDISHF